MPFTLAWEPPRKVFLTFAGAVTPAELFDSFDRVLGDPGFDQLRYCVVDFAAISSCEVAIGDLESLAAVFYGAYQSNPRVAAIAVATQACIERPIQQFSGLQLSPYPLHLVGTIEEARALIRELG